MREFADKLRDKNLTVGEALEIASKDAPKSRIERLNTFRNWQNIIIYFILNIHFIFRL